MKFFQKRAEALRCNVGGYLRVKLANASHKDIYFAVDLGDAVMAWRGGNNMIRAPH